MQKITIIIIGGGYAGLTILISLLKEYKNLLKQNKKIEIHLIDNDSFFTNQTYLHKTIYKNIEKFRISYKKLQEKYNFSFHQTNINFTNEEKLKQINKNRFININNKDIPFDYLVLTTGATDNIFSLNLLKNHNNIFMQNIKEYGLRKTLLSKIKSHNTISLIGCGATSIQFLFELSDFFRQTDKTIQLQIICSEKKILENIHPKFNTYIKNKIKERKIIFYNGYTFTDSNDNSTITIQEEKTKKQIKIQSNFNLFFSGVKANPYKLKCNQYGQIEQLNNIYAAGDNSFYMGNGCNNKSAQIAIRKAQTVSLNILSSIKNNNNDLQTNLNSEKEYNFKELGYFISLGSFDAIGWMLHRRNILTGISAFIIKEAIEAQFEFYLDKGFLFN